MPGDISPAVLAYFGAESHGGQGTTDDSDGPVLYEELNQGRKRTPLPTPRYEFHEGDSRRPTPIKWR